jgi:hypothetical protein
LRNLRLVMRNEDFYLKLHSNKILFFKDFDLQKRALNELQQEHNQLKEILANREKLIQVIYQMKTISFF